MLLAPPPYIGLRLTLTLQNQNYNLLQLIQAVAPYSDIPAYANQVNIRAGANAIQIGGADLSAANEGDTIPVNALKTYGSFHTPSFPLGSLYLRCNTIAAATFNVELISVENAG